ncbi:MAG: bifunctional (p)ppGpp synthetase/guanosine-3',5'-bis(diphosphate) 3'-pyrophosphohydrolase [Candidatus Nitrohelix vancouverensis]|uniref:Bifunctional (P)ppGpp synthetase/guanosine-3',5'-bis(Diphosphate) 3'-pyrophosphohydrolase n=1 Tax=Candidatus Nitrohelix vancouverensis TaxID=2705534 RepID=A0A7T0G4J9_9BACT|nr:MAG: bifunctional (p)ppGpp synthetase/guanosine-3',5'-bis(diphosphate) 3'-pyrophosphohydrolase [Candidatus Nitrohelix vancouverensis]
MRKLSDITDSVMEYHPLADLDVIFDAYVYSAKAHRNQSRKSGEAYFSHPVEVAWNLTRLKMDEKSVAAGLLHDTIEDTLATPEEITMQFGEEVYQLVDGVTKISQIEFASKEESQAENYRKMILAMSKDIRVVLIKLADRAHNIKTLQSLSEERRRRIAMETLDIYAPIANRLGIAWLKAELEDGSMKHIAPEEYKKISKLMKGMRQRRTNYMEKVCDLIRKELKDAGIEGELQGRTKHTYSVYKKMIEQNISFDEVYDLIGIRVLTTSLKDCYAVLGLIHSLWKPIPGRFKDYIAMPKPNQYKSLHTTVIGPEGERVEIQIRTGEMHQICEEGIAAHWQYKDVEKNKNAKNVPDPGLNWVRHLIENQKDFKNPKEFLNAFKIDLFSNEVYVFTPAGEVVALPRGSTPVDYAFAVHTDIGKHCTEARVNGKSVSLRYKLRNGDQVEIDTSEDASPSREWLSFVKTSKARGRISNFINAMEKEKSLIFGKEILEKEIQEYGLDPDTLLQGEKLNEAIQSSGFVSFEGLLRGVGLGKVSAHQVILKVAPKESIEKLKRVEPNQVKLKEIAPKRVGDSPVRVECFNNNILLRLGKCCNPVPGEPITGYITRGRGVTVHHVDCPGVNNLSAESERLISVEWEQGGQTSFEVRVTIVAEDKPGQLAEITQAIAGCNINITRANIKQGANKRAYFDFLMEVSDLQDLNTTLAAIREVNGVIHLERVKEYNKKTDGGRLLAGQE